MIDAQTQGALQKIMARESRSLLMYVIDAYPWTTARGGPALAALNRLGKDEARAITVLGRYLAHRHVPQGPIGSYPIQFTSYNFIALDNLLPRLVEAAKAGVAALEHDFRSLGDPESRARVQQLLDLKRHHLAALEALASPAPEPAAT